MFLKNYTSNVPVSQIIYRIEQVLIKCGVSGIMKEYGPTGDICAITFQIQTPNGKAAIRLPADEAKATDALWANYVGDDKLSPDGKSLHWNSYKKKTRADFVEQGKRTVWKIIQEWTEIQLSMIQMKQADTLEVFMPYVYDGRQTLYQSARERGFKGLLLEHKPDASD